MYLGRANGQLRFRAPYDNLKFRSFWGRLFEARLA